MAQEQCPVCLSQSVDETLWTGTCKKSKCSGIALSFSLGDIKAYRRKDGTFISMSFKNDRAVTKILDPRKVTTAMLRDRLA